MFSNDLSLKCGEEQEQKHGSQGGIARLYADIFHVYLHGIMRFMIKWYARNPFIGFDIKIEFYHCFIL